MRWFGVGTIQPGYTLIMRKFSQSILFGALLLATAAQGQYYGGVTFGNDRQRLQSGINGGETPSEQVSLRSMISANNGLNLSAESSVGIKLGYRFTPYFSVEGHFADRASSNNIFAPETGAAMGHEKTMGLDLVGTVPIIKKISLLGRAGYRNESFAATGAMPSAITSTLPGAINGRGVNSGVVGLGVQVNFTSSLGLRFEVERSRKFFTDRAIADADNVSFGVIWRF